MKALTAAEMREVDRLTTERFGVSSLALMEAAGKCIADAILAKFSGPPSPRIVLLCGKGNNGGDGFVAARYLHAAGADPNVYLLGQSSQLSGDAATNFRRWREAGGAVVEIPDENSWLKAKHAVTSAEIIVDAMLGTGLRGAASGIIAKVIDDLNRLSGDATLPRPALIFAVDIPSGLPSDGGPAEGPVLHAHHTLTFSSPKIAQLVSQQSAAVGTLQVCNIGSPPSLIEDVGMGKLRWVESAEFASLPLIRSADAHKGNFGHVLLVAGSTGKSGAAILAGSAALHGGAGLVTIATPEPVLHTVAAGQPEYMTSPLAATPSGTIALSNLENGRFAAIQSGKSVLALGPGLGDSPETQEFIRCVVREATVPVVLDADGLNAFAGHGDSLGERKSASLVITPHPGEMARLLGTDTKEVQRDRAKAATDAARRWNAHVVLKGFHTIISSPQGELFVNTTGNVGLAKGGSGDVLTGFLAALTAQFGTQDWPRTIALAAYLHGLAAEIASEQIDPSGILAGDVARAIPVARRKLLQELQRSA